MSFSTLYYSVVIHRNKKGVSGGVCSCCNSLATSLYFLKVADSLYKEYPVCGKCLENEVNRVESIHKERRQTHSLQGDKG